MTVKVSGMKEVQHVLSVLAPKEAKNIMRSAVHGVAGEARDKARGYMSSDTGTMKASTKIRRRRAKGTRFRSDVMVTKAAYYWRFREYGQGPDGIADAMFLKTTEWLRKNLDQMLRDQFAKKFEARMKRLRKG